MRSIREHLGNFRQAYLVLAISVLPAFAMLWHLLGISRSQVSTMFQRESLRTMDGIRKEVLAGVQPVMAVAGFYSAQPEAGYKEWNQFSQHSGIRQGVSIRPLPLLDVGVIWRTPSSDFERAAKHYRELGYSLLHSDQRLLGADRFLAVLLENLEGRQPLDTAWDSSFDGEIRLAMEIARDTGLPASTGVISLYQKNRQSRVPGIVVLVPIFRGAQSQSDSAVARRESLLGFAYGSVVTERLWPEAGNQDDAGLVSWKLVESDTAGGKVLGANPGAVAPGFTPRFRSSQAFSPLGRPWLLEIASLPALERPPQGALPWVIFLACLTLSGGLFAIALSQVHGRRIAEQLAAELKRAEANLRQEKLFSDAILNELPGLFVLLDQEGRLVRWNRNLETLTGLSSMELRQLECNKLFTGSNASDAAEQLQEVFKVGRTRMQVSIKAREGDPVACDFSGYHFRSANQGFCLGIGMDHSGESMSQVFLDAKLAVESASLSQSRILEMALGGHSLDSIAQAVCRHVSDSGDGVACVLGLTLLPAARPVFAASGVIPEALSERLRRQCHQLLGRIDKTDPKEINADWPGADAQAQAAALGLHLHSPRLISSSHGRLIGLLVLVNSKVLADSGEQVPGVEAAIELASVVANCAQASHKADLFASLAETSSDLVAFAELEGKVLYLNQFGRELCGVSEQQLAEGIPCEVLFHDSGQQKWNNDCIKRLLAAGRVHQELTLKGPEGGTPVPVDLTAFRIGSGTPAGSAAIVAIVARDIRERIRIDQEREEIARKLVENQKFESLGVLAGGIAHDFNNLLTGILGSADLASMDLPSSSPVQPLLGQIKESSKRAAGLCTQLLAYAGKGRFCIEPLDLSVLVQDGSSLLRHSIAPNCELILNLTQQLPLVDADAQQLRQVLSNLVVNAAEAIGSGSGMISIGTGMVDVTRQQLSKAAVGSDLSPGSYVSLEVRDSGAGIEPSMLDRIFDPFFTTKFPGRGLGLASVLGIIRSHKGALRVESAPGQGSLFQILLPALASDSGKVQAKSDTSFFLSRKPPEPRSGTVLVVDDEDFVRVVTTRLLEAWGCEVHQAANGLEAVQFFRRNPKSNAAVLLDLAMPVMDGATACREIHKINPNTVVVVMSGFGAAEVAAHFDGETIASYLQKPFTAERLYEVVHRIVRCERQTPQTPPTRE